VLTTAQRFDVVVIGAGPAGTAASLRAADLGAKTALLTRDAFGGMAANTGPIPVRTLAHAARLAREARQLARYGIVTGEKPHLDYVRLVARAREVVAEAREHSTLLQQVQAAAGVSLFENASTARFTGEHSIETESGLAFEASAIVICAGGVSRMLDVPGGNLAVTPADAFSLTELPKSLLVIGAGATGMQVASIFNAFGTRIVLCQNGPHIAPTEDDAISTELARAYREDGIEVHENCGHVTRIEATADGVRATFPARAIEAQLAVCCTGWIADTNGLGLEAAGVATDARGFIAVDEQLRTNVPHVFAAGDVVGHNMLVPQAVRDGYLAGGNAATGELRSVPHDAEPIGSFTDPEYAKVGLTEVEARRSHDVVVSLATYEETTRPTIDGRTRGFCKFVIDRATLDILGCHIVGERAVEVAQMAAIAMMARMKLPEFAGVPLSFPTYANVLGRAAMRAQREVGESFFIER
jgi:dihydrolipoamide dehydrogenase